MSLSIKQAALINSADSINREEPIGSRNSVPESLNKKATPTTNVSVPEIPLVSTTPASASINEQLISKIVTKRA